VKNVELSRYIEAFKSEARAAGFVLDFDGTLAHVVAKPEAARPFPEVSDTLEALASRYPAVALLSGRRADDLHSLVRARGVLYFGVYGAEQFEDGRLIHPPQAEEWRAMASRLAREAEALIVAEGLTGTDVEYKDTAVSIHYRRAKQAHAGEAILDWAVSAAPRKGFEASLGRMVVELRPQGVSKASAVERVVRERDLKWALVAGDDFSDLPALARAGELLGKRALRIGIESDESPEGLRDVSDLVVSDPKEIVAILKRFL
jgi:trehalose 6-phosphate phosphatase